jgi:hypothetical protein
MAAGCDCLKTMILGSVMLHLGDWYPAGAARQAGRISLWTTTEASSVIPYGVPGLLVSLLYRMIVLGRLSV